MHEQNKTRLTHTVLTFYFQLYEDKYTQLVETMMPGMHIYRTEVETGQIPCGHQSDHRWFPR